MWGIDWLLRIALAHVTRGRLQVTTASGTTLSFGDGTGPLIAVRFTSEAAQWAVLLDPDLKLGEAYMDGTLVVECGSIFEFVDLVAEKTAWPLWAAPITALRFIWRRIRQLNLRARARRNVAHHYDLDGRLYSLFLDSDRQYSCAYFETPQSKPRRRPAGQEAASGGQASARRRPPAARHRLRLRRARALCGGILRCPRHRHHAVAGAARGGARSVPTIETSAAAPRFMRSTIATSPTPIDRIVSVGMFEHVGVNFYDAFFAKCADILAPDGVMVLHSIGRSSGPSYTNAWIGKYIFPGGYIPALSEVMPSIERAGLIVTDIEILRLHYAQTIKAWRDRFLAHRDEVARLYDARFVRMWEFYLACSETAFRRQDMMVFQIQLARRQGVVPITRDYITHEEARLRALEARRRPPLRLAGE